MAQTALTLALVLAVVVPIALVRAHAEPGDRLVTAWAEAHGIAVARETREVVARYLRRSRVLRTWGAVAGALLPTLAELAVHGRLTVLGWGTDGNAAPGAVMWIFIGYVAGSLAAELSMARRRSGERRTASLVPRRVEDYVPRSILAAQRALALAVVLGVVASALVPYEPGAHPPGWAAVASSCVVLVALAAAVEALERWVVRRPQPFSDPPLVAADDAIRAQSLRAVAAGWLALLLFMCGLIAAGLASSDVTVLRSTMWVPAVVFFLLSLRTCLELAHRPWRVRRSAGAAGPAPT